MQPIGHDAKDVGEAVSCRREGGGAIGEAGYILQRAPISRADGHRIFVAVVAFPNVEGQVDKFEIIDALNPKRAPVRLGQRRQQQHRENGNGGNDRQQFNQCKTEPFPIAHGKIHGFHLLLSNRSKDAVKTAGIIGPLRVAEMVDWPVAVDVVDGCHRRPSRLSQIRAGIHLNNSVAGPTDVETELITLETEAGVTGLHLRQPQCRRKTTYGIRHGSWLIVCGGCGNLIGWVPRKNRVGSVQINGSQVGTTRKTAR